jgi:hypothetical protein
MKLTRKQAFELSIRKWEALSNGNSIPKDIIARGLKCNCGLCEKYRETSSLSLNYCAKCPIRPKVTEYDNRHNVGCNQHIHPWRQWANTGYPSQAQKVLNFIISKQ